MDITHPEVERYATEHSSPEPAHLVEVARRTRERFSAHGMMVGRLEGRFLKLLVAAVRAERVLEVGTFTGYSALSMAEALPPHGRVVTLEVSEEHAAVAREHFAASPYADRIDLRLGPAIETLRTLEGSFDVAFIDADKPGYPDYYEAVLPLLRRGGLILVDNVLQSGEIVHPDSSHRNVAVMRAFNERVASDPRVECVMVPIRDGVTMVRRID